MGKNKRKKSKQQQQEEKKPQEKEKEPSSEEEEKEEEKSASSSDEDDDQEKSEEEKGDNNDRPSKKNRPTSTDETAGAFVVASEAMPVAFDTFVGAKTTNNKQQPIIILLDQATLETVKNKKGIYELLNCDDHREIAKRKLRKDPNLYRPDILHQELLALQDSPLNKAGLLRIYVATQKKVLIEINPATRIPRTFKRFAGLMVQLLHKMKIRAGEGHTTLLKIIKNPFSQYLPAGTRCFGMSCQGTLYSPIQLASAFLPKDYSVNNKNSPPTCFVVGAMSTGHVQLEDHPYMEKMISVSEYPLSGAAALSRIMAGIEHHWGIV